jgi:hypothetical protein
MFLAVGANKRRLHMAMSTVYTDDRMFDRAVPHLHGMQAAASYVGHDGNIQTIALQTGVYLEWSAGKYERIYDESQLRFASRLVTAYHDDLRTESEQLDIQQNMWAQQEDELLEEVVRLRFEQWEEEGDTESDEACDDWPGWDDYHE